MERLRGCLSWAIKAIRMGGVGGFSVPLRLAFPNVNGMEQGLSIAE